MNEDNSLVSSDNQILEKFRKQLDKYKEKGNREKYARFVLAALGSVPWVGGFFGASSAFWAEKEQGKENEIVRLWLEEHQRKMDSLGETILRIIERVDDFEDSVRERLISPSYLTLVRSGFRIWDKAETESKREYVRRLLTNFVATTLCPDDLVRLFISWIDGYHEAHFMVIRSIYQVTGITRGEIWDNIYDYSVAENSAEADIFKLLITDLSIGRVIRQQRVTTSSGHFVKKKKASSSKSKIMKSAFDRADPYELTELGKQFVHYTMEEVVTQVSE